MVLSLEVRRQVIERANNCCEYCQFGQTDSSLKFHVEHIIALYHGGRDSLDNLALSCPACNRFKGSNIAAADPLTGDPTFLFHPRRDVWDEHFSLDSAMIYGTTPQGRTTVFVLRFNTPLRVLERASLIAVNRYPCWQKG